MLAKAAWCCVAFHLGILHSVEGQYWTLQRELSIGTARDESVALTQILGLALGPDDLLYLTQWQVPAVTVVNHAGVQVRTIGRQGRGPGEFLSPAAMGWKGDTLWVVDPPQSRLSLFDRSGRFITSVSSVTTAPSPYLRSLSPDGVLADGSILSRSGAASSDLVLRGRVTRIPLLRVGRSGEVIDTIALTEPTLDVVRLEFAPNRGSAIPQPMNSRPVVTPTADGDGLLIVERRPSENRRTAMYRLTKVAISGDTVFSREHTYQPVMVSNATRDRIYRELTANITGGGQVPRARIEEVVRESVKLPLFDPPVNAVVAGGDGTIWIQREASGSETVLWDVLDSSGVPLGELRAPAGLRIGLASLQTLWESPWIRSTYPQSIGIEWFVLRRHADRSPGRKHRHSQPAARLQAPPGVVSLNHVLRWRAAARRAGRAFPYNPFRATML